MSLPPTAKEVVISDIETAVTEADWLAAKAQSKSHGLLFVMVGVFLFPVLSLATYLAAGLVVGDDHRLLVGLVLMVAVEVPIIGFMYRSSLALQDESDQLVGALAKQLAGAAEVAGIEAGHRRIQARRQEFESRLANALDMAEGEPEVIDVIERSFAATLPESPVELLLADNSHAHLLRMASTSPDAVGPGCGVDSPDHCPAARRAQVQRFADSSDLDACPKLRGRPEGSVSAVCVPVSIMGRTVGVIHATATPSEAIAEDAVQDLGTLAKLAGARVGLLRMMAETQLQASTDNLTGLLNRRSFEQQLTEVRQDDVPLSVAMADLDHFKVLNDTHGHETGDRALRLFAQVLSGSMRAQDLICRHGGEEFVVALTNCTVESARAILDQVRARLDAAITVAGLPAFTVSFGVVQAQHREELPTVIGRADSALFRAKRDGRDRVVVHDALGNAVAPTSGLSTAPGRSELFREEVGLPQLPHLEADDSCERVESTPRP